MGTQNRERLSFQTLCNMSNVELQSFLDSAEGPTLDSLVGYEWRGYNRPVWTALLGIRKFIKGFFAIDRKVEGYNIPVRQNVFTEPWLHKPSTEYPHRFAFFVVTKVESDSKDNFYPTALLLNYGVSMRNRSIEPSRAIRDYLVKPDPQNSNLLLGKAYFAIGPFRMFSNFFIIERLQATDWEP